ncbi:MAG: cyclic nucleotide-binding domain-containing protein [Rhodospirillales bacterium]|nr:cyclic nucleotide-binding domain-containing protein [Rhodospirillales bacterium]
MRVSPLSDGDLIAVRRSPLLSGLEEADLVAVLEGATARFFQTETWLFGAGDPADRLFIVVNGAVRLFILKPDGEETIIEVVGADASFAEAAIFSPATFPVNAVAMAGTRLVGIAASSVLRALRDNSAIGLRMLTSLGRWEARLMTELRRLKALPPAQRLAWYLLGLTTTTHGAIKVLLPFRKSVIASRIGMTPESFSRALVRLRRLGIESRGQLVEIGDVAALREFCRSRVAPR